MKKFKNIADFNSEQQRLKIRQLELEKEISSDWKNVKTSLAPGNIAQSIIEILKSKTDKLASAEFTKSLFSAGSKFGITLLMKKASGWLAKKGWRKN